MFTIILTIKLTINQYRSQNHRIISYSEEFKNSPNAHEAAENPLAVSLLATVVQNNQIAKRELSRFKRGLNEVK